MGVLYASVTTCRGTAPVSPVSPTLALLDHPAAAHKALHGQVDALLRAFAGVPDSRRPCGVRFRLPTVLGLALLAVTCGAVGFDEIAEVAADLTPELRAGFGLVRSAPSAATFRRVINATDPLALDEAGAVASVGTTGDSYDNALAEAFHSLFKAELIRNRGPWKSLDEVEIAVAEYVDWFNHRRLHGEMGLVPPAEFEDDFYGQRAGSTEGEALVPSLQ
ncbi:transposase family protein [Nocardiopsis sp. N85]|nr:transposase family protein [Nocardiopsis sp. N85]MDE3725210.1 transposase family protein [Nocardiopsis sp. N85]